MQFKVPQDVQQADRIVSFLTLQQLIMCVVGGGFAYAVYTILHKQGLPAIFWIPPVGVILLLTAAFAFLKIANLPFYRYLIVLIERLIMPSRRVWIKGADRVISDEAYVSPEEQKAKEKEEQSKALIEEKEAQLKGIGSLMNVLETEKGEKDATTDAPEKEAELKEIEETPDEKLLQKAFLEKTTATKKETPEDKILKASVQAKPSDSSRRSAMPVAAPPMSATPAAAPAVLAQSVAGKKKRKRKRKRKNLGVMVGVMGGQVQPLPIKPATPPQIPAVVAKTPGSPLTGPPVQAPAQKTPTVLSPVAEKPTPAPTTVVPPPKQPVPQIMNDQKEKMTNVQKEEISNAPVAPELELTETTTTAIEEVPPEPLVVQEKEELMIPEEPILPPVAEPAKPKSESLQAQGEFTADQLRAGATLKVPTP